jgi:hypothetical protein
MMILGIKLHMRRKDLFDLITKLNKQFKICLEVLEIELKVINLQRMVL